MKLVYGCGDGNQLTYFNFKKYTGVDVSQKAISNCKLKFSNDVTKQFVVLNEYSVSPSELALSLDVIYHLVEDETYNSYMKMLFASSKKYVCIYSSNDDNHENNSVSVHVLHRKGNE